MTALQKEYQNLKLKYPNAVIWFSVNGYVESFSDCAVKTADTLKTTLTNKTDTGLALTGFPVNSLETNLKKMIKSGHKIALVEPNKSGQK